METLYAFAWAFGLFNELDFEKECPNTLVSLYPNLKADETSVGFRKQTVLRSIDDIVAACDLAFVLHWSVNQAAVEGEPVPGKVPPYVIMERRRALEWMLSPEDWDQFSLDT